MAISRHFFKEHNFILIRFCGLVSDCNLREHILAFNRQTRGLTGLRELVDCRKVDDLELLTIDGTTQGADLVENLPDARAAIVVNDSPLLYGMARAFQMFFESRRGAVEIFKKIDDAVRWLAKTDHEAAILDRLVKGA